MCHSNDLTITAAHEELLLLERNRAWMTARSLAKRIRRNHPDDGVLGNLSQVKLSEVLISHAYPSSAAEDPRLIRNHPLPSIRTLETLWGAVSLVGKSAAVESPILHADIDPESALAAEDEEADDESPDFFLSYNFADRGQAERLVSLLENHGHSVWMAGSKIADGENIHVSVREAIQRSQGVLLYLSSDSLCSTWVAKENLVADALALPLTLILNGNDTLLMEQVRGWLTDKKLGEIEKDIQQIHPGNNNVYLSEASHRFYGLLRKHVLDRDRTLFVYPASEIVGHKRLASFDGDIS